MFAPWTYVPDIGFQCAALCTGERCADNGCKKHHILAANSLQYDDDLGDRFCGTCWNVNLSELRGVERRKSTLRPSQESPWPGCARTQLAAPLQKQTRIGISK